MSLSRDYFVLKNGAIIEITPTGEMQFKDQNGNMWGKARPREKTIIMKLLETPGEYIVSRNLCANGNVRKALQSLNPTILCNIENKYGDGYRILLQPEEITEPCIGAIPMIRNTGLTSDLAGGYYCFYLDSYGHPLAAYVHIECVKNNDTTHMKAYSIFGIDHDDDLTNAPNVFNHSSDYETHFHDFAAQLSSGDAACLWAVGEVKEYASHLIAVVLKGAGEARWNIIIDASAYMMDKRKRLHDSDFFRGGMATVIAAWSPWGTTAFRFGMVRRSCFNPEIMSLNSPIIINKLRPTYHVNLSSTVDRDFYTWLDENRPKTPQQK